MWQWDHVDSLQNLAHCEQKTLSPRYFKSAFLGDKLHVIKRKKAGYLIFGKFWI